MQKTKWFDYNIEALRGFAALLVVLGHVINTGKFLDPNYSPSFHFRYAAPAHTSVLIFFVLSGYVIGLTNKSKMDKRDIYPYMKKRLIRLFPIYAIVILGVAVVMPINYKASTVLFNLMFLQVAVSPIMEGLDPIWSLHYEIVFYLLFIPVSYFNINPVKVAIVSFVLGFSNYLLFPSSSALFTSIMYGFSFWTVGLSIAKHFQDSIGKTKMNYSLMLSSLFLLLSLESLNFIHSIFRRSILFLFEREFVFDTAFPWAERAIKFNDFSYLPYCVFFVMVFSGKQFKYRNYFYSVLLFLPMLKLILAYFIFDAIFLEKFFVFTGFYAVSIILFFIKNGFIATFSKYMIKKSVWLGSVSYGVYIIHYPILAFMNKIDFFSGSYFTYYIRFVVLLFLTFLTAYILEKKLYPAVKMYFSS
ncbi:acyltransferase [Rufibacter sp. LB8]|uniref:acyltransferase family protein n=1 Tax=Rufibacter sp. LB8 TaxID=2777781 RepID=UPI00178C1D22|nr:acyltransferase [Rufibacter sp. LB8]